MVDRFVSRVDGSTFADDDPSLNSPRGFSTYGESANIVLLGDPGAGKTSLFESECAETGGKFYSVRNFLNSPIEESGGILFLDGLDEERGRSGGDRVIDQVVRTLYEVKPALLRLSCRAVDWFGPSDLGALRPYFDVSGGYDVLVLEALTVEQQSNILDSIGEPDPSGFLDEARHRGLQDFLGNPQTLILLFQVVEGGMWPENRRDLFERAAELLAREMNTEHLVADVGSYELETLLDVAGKICAARLISGVSGLSLRPRLPTEAYPDADSVDSQKIQCVREVLGRRLFRQASQLNTVDYSHRTTAEYLAARWISGAIRRGLPLRRITALLWVDGEPASELRGLNAWLAIHHPEAVDRFVDADPIGVLLYGDANVLEAEARRRLLRRLIERPGDVERMLRQGGAARAIGTLSGEDLVDEFQAVLNASDVSDRSRMVVMEAMAKGEPLCQLIDDVFERLLDGNEVFRVRSHAIIALRRMGEVGFRRLVESYFRIDDRTAHGMRIKCELAELIFPEYLSIMQLACLIWRFVEVEEELALGNYLRRALRSLTEADTIDLLDILSRMERPKTVSSTCYSNLFELRQYIPSAMVRLINGESSKVTPQRLIAWLSMLVDFSRHSRTEDLFPVREAIESRPSLARALAMCLAEAYIEHNNSFVSVLNPIRSMITILPDGEFYSAFLMIVEAPETTLAKRRRAYEMMWDLLTGEIARGHNKIQELFDLCDLFPELSEICERKSFIAFYDGQLEHLIETQQDALAQENGEAAAVQQLLARLTGIRAGADIEAMEHLGKDYWWPRDHLDDTRSTPAIKTRIDVIARRYGGEIAAAASEGFIALLSRDGLPTLEDIADAKARNSIPYWWVALLCGLNEYWSRGRSLDALSEDLLTALCMLEILMPCEHYKKNVLYQGHDALRDEIALNRPSVMLAAVRHMLDAEIANGQKHSLALSVIFGTNRLSGMQTDLALEILSANPTLPIEIRNPLVRHLLGSKHSRHALMSHLEVEPRGSGDAAVRMSTDVAVAAFIIAPDKFEATFRASFRDSPDAALVTMQVWSDDFMGEDEGPISAEARVLSVVIELVGSRFPQIDAPSSGWTRDSPYSFSRFVDDRIGQLAALASDKAITELERLKSIEDLSPYAHALEYALSSARAAYRDARFERPDWSGTLMTLRNGPPANVDDLKAFVVDHLETISDEITNGAGDGYRQFWNVDGRGRILPNSERPEDDAQRVLWQRLRERILPFGATVERERRMARDRRADLLVRYGQMVLPIEIKRDSHRELWTAMIDQLDRFYTIDPEASGRGIYLVLWYGGGRKNQLSPHPQELEPPSSASELKKMLLNTMPEIARKRIDVVVFDVSPSSP